MFINSFISFVYSAHRSSPAHQFVTINSNNIQPLTINSNNLQPLTINSNNVQPLTINSNNIQPLTINSNIQPYAINSNSVHHPLTINSRRVLRPRTEPRSYVESPDVIINGLDKLRTNGIAGYSSDSSEGEMPPLAPIKELSPTELRQR